MGRFNKASLTAILGAATTCVLAIWPEIDPKLVGAVSTLILTIGVYLIPNTTA